MTQKVFHPARFDSFFHKTLQSPPPVVVATVVAVHPSDNTTHTHTRLNRPRHPRPTAYSSDWTLKSWRTWRLTPVWATEALDAWPLASLTPWPPWLWQPTAMASDMTMESSNRQSLMENRLGLLGTVRSLW